MHFITGMYSLSLYITTCHARDGVSDTPDHSHDIYLPSSSLIGDTDTVAWLRATRCTGTRPHRASQAAIACTPSLHRTPPFQAANTKALLVLSGRGAAVALVALRRVFIAGAFRRLLHLASLVGVVLAKDVRVALGVIHCEVVGNALGARASCHRQRTRRTVH